MKKSVALFTILAFVIASCGSSKKTPYGTGMTEYKLPFSSSEFKTDKTYYRVVSHGSSPNISMAEKKAMANAREQMTLQIKALVQVVTRNFAEETSDLNSSTGGDTFESLSTSVASQLIPNITVKDSKVLKSENNVYEYWVCIEVLRKDIQNRAVEEISSKKAMKIESNRDKFQKIFDQEMDKLNQ